MPPAAPLSDVILSIFQTNGESLSDLESALSAPSIAEAPLFLANLTAALMEYVVSKTTLQSQADVNSVFVVRFQYFKCTG